MQLIAGAAAAAAAAAVPEHGDDAEQEGPPAGVSVRTHRRTAARFLVEKPIG